MKFAYWLTCTFFLIASSSAFSQKKLVPLVDIVGTEGAWIHDITIVDKKLFLIDGVYKGRIAFGQDTLAENSEGQDFVTQFEGDTVTRAMICEGSVAGIDREFFCLVDAGETFTKPTIAKYNLNNQLIWKYSLSLSDSFPAFLHLLDIGFDKDNTYLFFVISTENGQIHLNNEVITGPGNLLVKLDSRGELSAFKKIANVHTYNKLKIVNGKICVYSTPSIHHFAFFSGLDLQEEKPDDELCERLKFPVWDNNEYFRIVESGSRPKRLFILEKYSAEKGVTTRTEVFRDTVRFQSEIYQHEIFNFDEKEIVIVYVSRGQRSGNKYLNPQINILIVNKKSLEIHQRIVIDCDRLTPENARDISFNVHGTGLLIGSDYRSNCRIGNLSFGNEDNTTWSSFFVVKQPLK